MYLAGISWPISAKSKNKELGFNIKSKLIDKELKKLIENTLDTIESIMPFIREEVHSIIAGKETSEHRIESALDMLLDYLYWGYGEKEFKELNGYYSTISPEYAADYQRFYDEIMEEEEEDGED